MKQTMESMLAPITARVNAEKAEAKTAEDVKAKGKELTFFEGHKPDVKSGKAEQAYSEAKTVAGRKTQEFVNSIQNVSHSNHNSNLLKYRQTFASDPAKVYQDYLETTCKEMNAPDPEDLKENPAYEAQLLDATKPKKGKVTIDSMAWHDILKTNLKKSRDARGYGKGKMYDNEIVDAWKYKYGVE